jgi:hypothetical protein
MYSISPKYSFLYAFVLMMFLSCTEIPPFIDFSEGPLVLRDTTYITNDVPAAEPKNVLIEDISGVRCVNCPSASETAKQILAKNPNRVFLATLHPTSLRQYTTPHQGYDTLSTEAAELIMQTIIGTPTGLPAGAINRVKFDEEDRITMAHAKWEKYALDEMATNSPVVLETNLEKDQDPSTAVIRVKATATTSMSRSLALTIMILESDIKSKQSTPTGYDEEYKHSYVLRETLTPFNGNSLSPSIETGRVHERDFELTLDPEWVPENCSLLVILHHNDQEGYEVVQVKKLDF